MTTKTTRLHRITQDKRKSAEIADNLPKPKKDEQQDSAKKVYMRDDK